MVYQMLKIFSVKDVKADSFNPPFFTTNRATAERDFRRLIKDEQTHLFHSPQDFELYELGNWDPSVGVIVSRDFPDLVIRALDCRPIQEEE